jgi:hypothetical protein
MTDERQLTIEIYHNVYKSLHGVRPKYIDFSSMTDREVDDAMERLAKDNKAHLLATA